MPPAFAGDDFRNSKLEHRENSPAMAAAATGAVTTHRLHILANVLERAFHSAANPDAKGKVFLTPETLA
ncbi:MAG: hypothetical protein ACREOO_29775 [bacterium]